MENLISSLHNDIQKLKNNNKEAIDMAKQAITKSNEAQTIAEEAKEKLKGSVGTNCQYSSCSLVMSKFSAYQKLMAQISF